MGGRPVRGEQNARGPGSGGEQAGDRDAFGLVDRQPGVADGDGVDRRQRREPASAGSSADTIPSTRPASCTKPVPSNTPSTQDARTREADWPPSTASQRRVT